MEEYLEINRNGMAVPLSVKYFKTKQGSQTQHNTTVRWALQINWKNGSTQWIKLKDLKESNPVYVEEYATARGIQEEPAFSWWVPYTLRKRDMIVYAVFSRIRKCSHKYGIEIPTSIAHSKRIDLKNGNNLWMDAITKEMTNVGIAFTILDEG